jgi:type II secretory pathway component PulC
MMFNKIRNLFNKSKKNSESDSVHEVNHELQDLGSHDEFEDDLGNEIESELDSTFPPLPSEDNTGTFNEEVFDLQDGKLSFRDKLNLTLENTKNSLGRLSIKKPKKMTIKGAKAPARKEKIANLIKVTTNTKLKKINWANLHNEFFSPNQRQKLHRLFQYSFVVLLTFTLAKTVGIILSGSNDYKGLPKNASLNLKKENALNSKDIIQIKNAKLFKTEAKKVEVNQKAKQPTNLVCDKADGKSRLPIKLINTIILQDSIKSVASIQVKSDSVLQELRVGEKINDMAKIGKIERSRLIIKNLKTGTCESIESDEEAQDYSPIAVLSPKASKTFKKTLKKIKGIENKGNDFIIEKSFLKAKLANPGDILKQARGIQINNPDGTISFKIVEVEPGGVFAHLGIENNDIITQINGQSINDLNAIMSLFSKLQGQNLSKLGLNIKRGGVDTPQQYSFK